MAVVIYWNFIYSINYSKRKIVKILSIIIMLLISLMGIMGFMAAKGYITV